MAFAAGPEPAYSIVEEHCVGRPRGMRRRALFTGLAVALVGTACVCALPGARILRARTASLVVLDSEAVTEDTTRTASTAKSDPEGASRAASAVKPDSEDASGSASAVKPNSEGASSVRPDRDEQGRNALSSSTTRSSSAAEPTVKPDSREQGMRRSAPSSSTTPSSDAQDSTVQTGLSLGSAVKPDSKESPLRVHQHRLRVVLADATAEAAALCIKHDVAHVPLDMPEHDVSYESSLDACQVRCVAVEGCETFTFFPADKSCHVQDGNTAQLSSVGAQSGRPTCDAMSFKKL